MVVPYARILKWVIVVMLYACILLLVMAAMSYTSISIVGDSGRVICSHSKMDDSNCAVYSRPILRL